MPTYNYTTYPVEGSGGSSSTGSSTAVYTIGPFGSQTANANGGTIGTSTITFQGFTATLPGMVSSASQTIGGAKTFSTAPFMSGYLAAPTLTDGSGQLVSGSISLTTQVVGNLPLSQTSGSISLTTQVSGILPVANGGSTGSNTGDVSLTSVGTSPNNSAASLAGQVLTIQPANATSPGVVSSTTQTFGGEKTFTNPVTLGSNLIFQPTVDATTSSTTITSRGTGYVVLTNAGLTSISAIDASLSSSSTQFSVTNLTGNILTFQHNGTAGSGSLTILTPYSASFPIPNNGTARFQLSASQNAWLYSGGTEVLTVGAFLDGVGNSLGATIASNTFYLQRATATLPGILSTSIQSISGTKTFSNSVSSPSLRSATAASNTIAINANGSQSTYSLNLPVLLGTTGQALALSNNNGSMSFQSVLSNPMTSTGDIIVGSASGEATRLPVGSFGQTLVASSASSLGFAWSSGGVITGVRSVSANDTALVTDDNLIVGSGTATVSLFPSDGNSGRRITVTRSFTSNESIILASTGSNTLGIGGPTAFVLDAQNESVTLTACSSGFILNNWSYPAKQQILGVVSSSWVTTRAVGVINKTFSTPAVYRLVFNIRGTTAVGLDTIDLFVGSVSFKNAANFKQAVVGGTQGGSASPIRAAAQPNSNDIEVIVTDPTGSTTWGVSGDVELDTRPTIPL